MSQSQTPLAVPQELAGYRLTRVRGGGGFSVVYLAEMDQEPVIIKEYFPAKFARRAGDGRVVAKDEKSAGYFRQGRKLFFQEASLLAAMDHPHIVKVLGFFQANDTVYLVMSYEKGISLYDYRRRYNRLPNEALVLRVFKPLLSALVYLHQRQLLHLDLKPGNVLIRKGGSPVLLDFGAVYKLVHQADNRMFPVISRGFSPPEQGKRQLKLGPWTDVYAFGATMRAFIEGRSPMAARERVKEDTLTPMADIFAGQYSPGLLSTIDQAMALDPRQRPLNMVALRQRFGW